MKIPIIIIILFISFFICSIFIVIEQIEKKDFCKENNGIYKINSEKNKCIINNTKYDIYKINKKWELIK